MSKQSLPDLEALEALAAVSERGSFTAAARALGLSKVALSRRVVALEEALGDRLLVRTTRSVHLTPAGEIAVTLGAGVLEQARELVRAVSDANRDPTGQLRIVTTPLMHDIVLEPVVIPFVKRYPKVTVVLEVHSDPLASGLERYDLALLVGPPRGSSLGSLLLGRSRLGCFALGGGQPAWVHARRTRAVEPSADYLDKHESADPPAPSLVARARWQRPSCGCWRVGRCRRSRPTPSSRAGSVRLRTSARSSICSRSDCGPAAREGDVSAHRLIAVGGVSALPPLPADRHPASKGYACDKARGSNAPRQSTSPLRPRLHRRGTRHPRGGGALAHVRDRYLFYYGGGGQGNHLPGAYATATRRTLRSRYRSRGGIARSRRRADFERCDVALFIGEPLALALDPAGRVPALPRRALARWQRARAGAGGLDAAGGPGLRYLPEPGASASARPRVPRSCSSKERLRHRPSARPASFEDLGVQMGPQSTLVSYLHRLLVLLTGNLGKPGSHYIPTTLVPLWGGEAKRPSPVVGARIVGGLVPASHRRRISPIREAPCLALVKGAARRTRPSPHDRELQVPALWEAGEGGVVRRRGGGRTSPPPPPPLPPPPRRPSPDRTAPRQPGSATAPPPCVGCPRRCSAGTSRCPTGWGSRIRGATAGVATGVAPNELTSSEDRDPFVGTPWHKHVAARLERLPG